MFDIQLMGLFIREIFGPRFLQREHSAIKKITSSGMVRCMEDGGDVLGPTAAGYLYHSAQICRTICGCSKVLDLGCGTGVQLMQVAGLNPGIHFVGVDSSMAMLDSAALHASRQQIANVSFVHADCADLSRFASNSVDGVMSTMTIHHAADNAEASRWLSEISRVLRRDGAVYIEDFGRLKSESSVRYFLSRARNSNLGEFVRLYEASLRAAFRADELIELLNSRLPDFVETFHTNPVPFLVIAKSRDRGFSSGQKVLLRKEWFDAMRSAQQKDYRELAFSFRLGGVREHILGAPER